MSMITDLVVVAMYDEDAAIAHVNARLAADERLEGQQIRPLDMSAAGGSKAITACVYAASFNYVDYPMLRDTLMAAPWRRPGSVAICLDGEVKDESERLFPLS